MTTKRGPTLRVKLRDCTGCRACTIACSIAHDGRIDVSRARIRVHKKMPEIVAPAFKPVYCRMCRNAKCIPACPTGALYEDPETGLVVLDTDVCDGCGNCVEACPFEAIWLDEERNLAVKCDLCGGEPVCVEYCSPGALVFS